MRTAWRAASILVIVAATMVPMQATGVQVTLSCTVTVGGPGPALHAHDDLTYTGCKLGQIEFPSFNVQIHVTHPDCVVEYDEDGDPGFEGHVTDFVIQGWIVWGTCPIGVVNQTVTLSYA